MDDVLRALFIICLIALLLLTVVGIGLGFASMAVQDQKLKKALRQSGIILIVVCFLSVLAMWAVLIIAFPNIQAKAGKEQNEPAPSHQDHA